MNNNSIDIKYRFPIFKSENWKLYKLSEIADYTNGRAHEQDIDVNGKYIVVNSKYISTDGSVVKYSNTANCIAEKNDILMVLSDVPNGRAIAKCYLVKENDKYTVNQRICRITPNQGIESNLLYYIMNRNPYFLSFDDGVKQTNLRNDDVLNFEILLPSNPAEQQKIAACLSSLDDVIAGHEEKLKALEEHKKGLMQNLFPQEGEKQPKYRFPEFENDGDWVEKKLGAIGDPLMCKRIFKEETSINKEGNIPFYKIGTFGKYPDSFISVEKFEDYKTRFSFPKRGDILISASGTIGRLVVYDGKPAYFQDSNIIWLGHEEDVIKNVFLLYAYEKLEWQTSDGGVISRLYNSDFKKMEIKFPKNQEEQHRIASVLSSVDELIIAQQEKIEALKEHKKGLMQGLFPKIES